MRRFIGGLLCALVGSLLFGACTGFLPPKADRCPGVLTCLSPSVPQTVSGGTCCINAFRANAASGYLCAWGANRTPAGCFDTLEDARTACPSAPTVVRCTANP